MRGTQLDTVSYQHRRMIGDKTRRKCVVPRQNFVSSLSILTVMVLLVMAYRLLPIRKTVRNADLSIKRLQDMRPLTETLEVRGPDKDRCVNLTYGFPQIRPVYLPDLKNPCWYRDDGQLSCLPYFYMAGIPKSGTTDLYSHVAKHPDIIKAIRKEFHWLTRKRFFSQNRTLYTRSIMKYTEYFKGLSRAVLSGNISGHEQITVDASVSTLWCNTYWARLKENCGLKEPKYITAHYIQYLLPRVKIIAIMRNPTDRLYSAYMFFGKKALKSKDDFHKKVLNAIDSFSKCLATSSIRACVYNAADDRISQVRLHIGLYYIFVQDWMTVFPKQQLHFIRFEDYIENRHAAVKAVYQFLEIRPLTSREEKLTLKDSVVRRANTKKKDSIGPMRNDTRKLLDDFYRPHKERLARLLGDNGHLWQ